MRIGVLDIVAAVALLVAVVLPSPARPIKALYTGEAVALAPSIARAQADVARDPKDAAAAARLSDLLTRARQTDWAVRAAVRAADSPSPERWRALVAVSAVHIDRLELPLAGAWAQKAVDACDSVGDGCPDFERARLEMYAKALSAAEKSGIDLRVNPKGVGEAAARAVPLIRFGGKK